MKAATTGHRATPRIAPFVDVALSARQQAEIDAIFFAASATQAFASETARAAFRDRWLGRYFERFPQDAWLALDADGGVSGYLVGSREDPARDPVFADIGYFADLGDVTPLYPAHLHINLAEAARSQGIGGRLVEAFVAQLRADGVAGVHVVTGAQSRNRTFYARLGFALVRELDWNGAAIVMLGRKI
jgi:GNAT superfamily N-acetyltransferase